MKRNRKLLLLITLILTALIPTGCQDVKSSNAELTVIFYTGFSNAAITPTHVPILYDFPNGDLIERPEDPVAPGLSFAGWYQDSAKTVPWDFDTMSVTQSMVLYAKWELLTLHIDYVFDEAGGQLIDAPITDFNVLSSQLLPKAERSGSLFIGWITTPIDQYVIGDRIHKTTQFFTTDVTLYALFENKEYTVRFRSLLTGVANPSTYTIKIADDISFPVLSDTSTKHFIGWFSEDGTLTGNWGYQYENGDVFKGKAVNYNSETQEWEFTAQNITVYGKWQDK